MNDPVIHLTKEAKGLKFEHILISVTIAHDRHIGHFEDTCAMHIERGMKDYQGVIMVDAKAQYRHCSYNHHPAGCDCGLCVQARSWKSNNDVSATALP